MSFRTIFPALAFLIAALTCGVRAAPRDEAPATQSALHDALVSRSSEQSAVTPAQPAPLLAFYAARDFAPAWTGSPEAEAMAAEVLAVLADADAQGLRSTDYNATAIRWRAAPDPGPEAAAYDLSLTADLLHYASDLCLGRVYPRDVYKDVSLPARSFDIAPALEQALKAHAIGSFLAGLAPPYVEYRGLVAALAHYRAIAAQGGWPLVPAKGEVTLDGNDPRLSVLTERLAAEDSGLVADGDLRDAVMRYQTRNGITADGRVGTDTLAALNKPVEQRIAEITTNLERWRWLPHSFEKRYVMVNVPDQSLIFVSDGKALLSSKVIVGRDGSKTPLVRMAASDVVANPPWDVPDDIAAASILPHLRANPNYLAARNMVLVDAPPEARQGRAINWRKMKGLPFRIQQNPGPDSAMGVLMLDSPNPYGVYLHDTPGKALFNAGMRQKSNGCIRVEDMFALASLAMTDDSGGGLDQLGAAVATGQTQRLALGEPLPIYLLYWTAMVGPDGAVGFRSDFYGRDKPLLAALAKPRGAVQ